MNKTNLMFCVASLLVSLILAIAIFPFTALPPEKVAVATIPVAAENLPSLDLGAFGEVTVADLLAYYIENPPAPRTEGVAPARTEHFGGC